MTRQGEVRAPVQIGELIAYGHSLIAGDLASDSTRDVMTHLAAMLGAKERNYAKGSASLMYVNNPATGHYGVIGTLLQTYKRPIRAASTIATVDPAVGATVLTLAQNPQTTSATGVPFRVNDTVHIGTGSTGATGGEIARVVATSATQITLGGFEGLENYSGLVRDHAIGDPVYVVPTHYGAGNTLFLLGEGGNQLARYGSGVYNAAPPGQNAQRWYQEALRLCISRFRAAEIFEPDHSALVFSGSWGAAISSIEVSGSFAAQGGRNPTAVNAAVTFHVPDNFPGGTVAFNFIGASGNTGGGVWTFTVDGAAWTVNGPNTGTGNTFTTIATPTTPSNKPAYYCARLQGLAAGRHTIVATMSTLEANNYFDFATIEAEDPPVVMVVLGHRFLSWDPTGGLEHGHLHPTLSSQANAGATSVQVTQSPVSTSRQIAATPQVPKAGEFIVINPQPGDVSPQEVRTVTTVTGASAPFTINFSGGGLSNTHASGTRVELGVKDYDCRNVLNPWTASVKGEFDDYVILHDPDIYLNKDPQWFGPDDAHPTDKGAAYIAEQIYRQLESERLINQRTYSRLSRPITTMVYRVTFLATNTAFAWTNMPSALTEFGGVTNFRQTADLSRFYECRLGCIQTAAGSTGAKLRLQYSIDAGTSWRHLNRIQNATDSQATSTGWAEPTAATDTVCQIPIGAGTGLKTSVSGIPSPGGWAPIYPEASMPQYEVQLRIIGIGGNGVLDPAFMSIWAEFR